MLYGAGMQGGILAHLLHLTAVLAPVLRLSPILGRYAPCGRVPYEAADFHCARRSAGRRSAPRNIRLPFSPRNMGREKSSDAA